MNVVELPIEEIYADHDWNCRGRIAPIEVDDLAKSILQVGLQQPLVVQPWDKVPGKKWRIVSGYRRYTACCRVPNLITIACHISEGLSELQAKKLNGIENLHRENLNIKQEARMLIPFQDANWGVDRIAKEFNVPRHWVDIRLKLLSLPEEIQNEAAAGFLTQDHIRQLARFKSAERQFAAVKQIKERRISGEKQRIEIIEKKVSPLTKKSRNKGEIFGMQSLICEAIGNCIATRFAAWITGEISEWEFLQDLKAEADCRNVKWDIPIYVLDRVNLYKDLPM